VTVFEEAWDAARFIEARASIRPRVLLVLGSGLGHVADSVQDVVALPYQDIPNFPVPSAPGHAGTLFLGRQSGREVAIMAGRAHLYEGYTAAQVALPLRAMRLLGVDILLITNAAGGINPAFQPGSLMVITDHINLTGANPLVGPNEDRLGPRFPDMTEAYDSRLRKLALSAGGELGLHLTQGVYLGLQGPSFETPAEIRMARTLGADAVGMSTVMEVIAANHAGMRVLGISCITNLAAGISEHKLSEQDVIEWAERVRAPFAHLIAAILARLPT
jgi:purine-nucleoside phosphorylase